MKYANKVNAEFVAVIGDTELSNKTVQLKNMTSGEQKEVYWDDLIDILR